MTDPLSLETIVSECSEESLSRFDEVIEFRAALSQETDRGCALFSGSYLDGQLEALLRQRLVDDKSVVDNLLRIGGPLGTFSARIDAALLLGLISDQTRRDMDLIRRIRNEFGHSARSIAFSEQSIASRCRELKLVTRPGEIPPRARFTNAVLGVAAMIHAALQNTRHIHKARDLHPDDMAEVKELVRRVHDGVDYEEGT